MTKEPDMSSIYLAQLGALEAELERVKKDNHNLQQQNDLMARILRQMIEGKEESNGEG